MKRFKVFLAFTLVLSIVLSNLTITVSARRGSAPVASNVTVSGTTTVGSTLTGSYTYYDADGDLQGTSLYQWFSAATLSGTYYSISGATAKTYTLKGTDQGKYFKFQVTPVAVTGIPKTGSAVQSAAVGPVTGTAPVVTNVTISGTLTTGQTLTGQYTYTDADGDVEGTSLYQWLSSTASTGPFAAVAGATAKTYTLASTDAGKYFIFQITPVSKTGTPNTGSAVQSAAVGPIAAPVVTAPTRVVMGFAVKYYSTDTSSYNSMVNNTKSIDQISTVTYTTDSYGNLSGTAPSDQISYANSNGIKPFALVSNSDSSGFNSTIAKSILENSTNSQALINNLVNAIKLNGYKGVNVDFENVPYTDRTYYTQFITNMRNTLSPLGYLTTISVPAETVDSPTNSWNGAFDYTALGQAADEILIMSYDEHGTWSSAGPVASIGWVTNVVNYAKSTIPANKILVGLAAYGYDWSSAGNKALSLNQIYNLVSTYGGAVQWDATSESPYYIYTDTSGIQHTIWFENGDSIAYKCDLVNQNNLLGVGIWRLGLENSAYWSTINTKFNR